MPTANNDTVKRGISPNVVDDITAEVTPVNLFHRVIGILFAISKKIDTFVPI